MVVYSLNPLRDDYMKKKFLILFVVSLFVQVLKAQNTEVKFYTLKECQYDTLVFLERNYSYNPNYAGELGNWGPRYIEQPLQVLFDEAKEEGVVFKSYCWYYDSFDRYFCILLFVESKDRAREKIKKGEICCCVEVHVGFRNVKNREEMKQKKEMKLFPIDKSFLKKVKDAWIYQVFANPHDKLRMPKE